MTLDPTSMAALVGAASSMVGAAVFALRSRVKLAEVREEKRMAAEIAADEERTRREHETREDRDGWRARAESAEQREHDLAVEVTELRADHEIQCATCRGRRRR